MFSGKLGVMKHKWGYSSTLMSRATTTLRKAHKLQTPVHQQAITPSPLNCCQYDVITPPPFWQCVWSVWLMWCWPGDRKIKGRKRKEGWREKMRVRKQTNTQNCHHFTTPDLSHLSRTHTFDSLISFCAALNVISCRLCTRRQTASLLFLFQVKNWKLLHFSQFKLHLTGQCTPLNPPWLPSFITPDNHGGFIWTIWGKSCAKGANRMETVQEIGEQGLFFFSQNWTEKRWWCLCAQGMALVNNWAMKYRQVVPFKPILV